MQAERTNLRNRSFSRKAQFAREQIISIQLRVQVLLRSGADMKMAVRIVGITEPAHFFWKNEGRGLGMHRIGPMK